ncbi:MAG TPA: 16S rRNA (adenine(1518)-N(6)/adenine(1519)-N(6))-dimethyltransferase RsmA [Chloroflexaceae bacterium]|nr:16S rRNA (adenine(1518)-N(6)/adenine(1519)-N(6))-dimethyltransferase RsmA [Chloroflexaceae bacterium]
MSNPYLDPQRVRAALRALDLRPTRGMGQNFLVDGEALGAIVAAAELGPADLVVEVGPGLGVLTWELTRRAGHTIAVELDRRLAARLRDELPYAPLTIVEADVLRVQPGELLAAVDQRPKTKDQSAPAGQAQQGDVGPSSLVFGPRYKLVANLPYAITSAVLRHFLEAAAPPELSVVLVQYEVAERITAGPGDLSVLAHSVQIYAEPELVARVPAASFFPAPAVASAVLLLRRRPCLAVEVDSVDRLFRVIKAGFLHARKQLGNSLPGGLAAMGHKLPREQVQAALAAAGVAPQRRAETLTLEEWAGLYEALGPAL